MMQHPLLSSSQDLSDHDTEEDSDLILPFSCISQANPSRFSLRRTSTDSSASSTTFVSTTATALVHQQRIHTVKPGDTIEGICIAHGCSISSLKQLNRLFWSSDSIHLRKTLLIPERIQHQSNGLSLKHTLSAHPQNLRLFGCSETRDSSSPHRNEKEESESRNSSRSNKDLFWSPSVDLNRFRNQLTEDIQNDKLASILGCLDEDLEYILATLVKPAPDTRPSDTHPIICISRQTITVSIYYTHMPQEYIIQTKNIDKKSGIPKSPSLNPSHFPPTANPNLTVPLARILELHPETHNCPLESEKKQEWTAQRPQWRVLATIKERIAVVLGDSVKKVVEADVSGRIFKKLAF